MSSTRPVAYTINHDGLKLELAILESDQLHLHEEIIPEQLEGLKQSIIRSGYLESPVIVDRDSLVVLDGMHRVNVVRMLNCRFITVCMVNYFDKRITLGRWCRTIPKPFNSMMAIDEFSKMGYILKPAYGVNPLVKSDLFVVFGNGSYFVEAPDSDIVSIAKVAYDLELKLKNEGYFVRYASEDDSSKLLASGKISSIICPPLISKEQVVKIATSGQVFAPKSTRHKLPARPMGVSVPLTLLNDLTISVEEANIALKHILEEKKLTKLSPGSIFYGRKYDETLYVFNS
jgi:hypothetical protein